MSTDDVRHHAGDSDGEGSSASDSPFHSPRLNSGGAGSESPYLNSSAGLAKAILTRSSNADDILIEGNLTKRTNHLKSWKPRYFQLLANELVYYKDRDKKDAEPRGIIPLQGCFVYSATEKTGKPHCFQIYNPSKRNFYMYADSEQEYLEWLIAIRRAIYSHYRAQVGGRVYTWGYPVLEPEEDAFVPMFLRPLMTYRVTDVAVGDSHHVAVTDQGEVFTWGRNTDGQLGVGDVEIEALPVSVGGMPRVTSVACGLGHTMAVAESGALYAWGRNDFGQLGLSDLHNRRLPQVVSCMSGTRVALAVCGQFHTIIRTATGEVHSAGWGQYGQLGHGDNSDVRVFTKIDALSGHRVSLLACGEAHSCVVLKDTGDFYSWGKGTSGQLGHGDGGTSRTPRLVQTLSGMRIVNLACGENHTAALTSRGEIYTWGSGKHGQLCQGLLTDQWTPRLVEEMKEVNVTTITCGARCTLAATEDGDVYSWGLGEGGTLGHSSTNVQVSPKLVDVMEGKGVSQIKCCATRVIAVTKSAEIFSRIESARLPFQYLCAMTTVMMSNPVRAADGHTYEREAVELWFEEHPNISPATGRELSSMELNLDANLRAEIREFKRTLL